MVDEKKEIYRLWWEFLKRSKIYKSIYENHEEIITAAIKHRNYVIPDLIRYPVIGGFPPSRE